MSNNAHRQIHHVRVNGRPAFIRLFMSLVLLFRNRVAEVGEAALKLGGTGDMYL